MRVQLNRAHFPVTALGPGRRIGLWFQGCGIGCPGCVSLDTWAADPSREVALDVLLDWCASLPAGDVDGVTISGGEPFDQPEALCELLRRLRDWRAGTGREIDLLCYSGRSLGVLRRRFPVALGLLDAVIPGRYVAGRPTDASWRGSANQPLVPLSPLGRRRYADADAASAARPRLQVAVDDETIWCIGIPRRGDLDRLEQSLAARGVRLEGVSWRT